MTNERADDGTVGRRELLGSVGVAAVAATAGCSTNDDGDDGDDDGPGENEVVVGPGGSYAFEPASLSVSVGETVTWTWDSANHNVVVSDQPDAASWSGTDGDASTTYDVDHTYEHAFETPGTYEYYCQPHEGLGMTGEVVVEE